MKTFLGSSAVVFLNLLALRAFEVLTFPWPYVFLPLLVAGVSFVAWLFVVTVMA